jgi:MFS family permease
MKQTGLVSTEPARHVNPSPDRGGQHEAASPILTPAAKRIVPWLCGTALFMELLDATIVNTAVPTIATALHTAPLSLKTVLTSYTLSLAVFIPISGWMADRFGTRGVFSSAVAIFLLGSLACGLAVNVPSLAPGVSAMRLMRLIGPLHDAFVTLGVLTALSAAYFASLRPDDGANVSHQRRRAAPEALAT